MSAPTPHRLRLPAPKISGTGESFTQTDGPVSPTPVQRVTDEVTQTWATFVTALGLTAPSHVNRIERATSALKRYGG